MAQLVPVTVPAAVASTCRRPSRLAGLAVATVFVLLMLALYPVAASFTFGYWDLVAVYITLGTAIWLAVLFAEVAFNGGSLLSVKTLFFTSLYFFHVPGANLPFVAATTPQQTAPRAFFVILTALAAAGLGVLWFPPVRRFKVPSLPLSHRSALLISIMLSVAGWAAFAGFAQLWGLRRFLLEYGPHTAAHVGGTAQVANHLLVLAWLLWTAALWLTAMGWLEARRRALLIVTILGCLPLILLLIAGYRGQALRTLAGLLILRHIRKRYSLRTIVISGLALLLLSAFIGLTRGSGGLAGLQQQLAQRFPSFVKFVVGVGSMSRVVAATVDRVGTVEDYAYGTEYFTQVIGKLVPVVGWDLTPWPSFRNLHPGVWASVYCWRVSLMPHATPEMIGTAIPGLGFSMIAEAFLNFGWGGVIVVPLLMTGLAVWLDHRLTRCHPFAEILLLQLSVNLLMAARGAVEQLLDGITLLAVLVILLYLFAAAVVRANRGPALPTIFPPQPTA